MTVRTSPRERDVLWAIEQGLSQQEVAAHFGIAVSTVRTVTKRLLLRWPGRVPDLPARARADGVRF